MAVVTGRRAVNVVAIAQVLLVRSSLAVRTSACMTVDAGERRVVR